MAVGGHTRGESSRRRCRELSSAQSPGSNPWAHGECVVDRPRAKSPRCRKPGSWEIQGSALREKKQHADRAALRHLPSPNRWPNARAGGPAVTARLEASWLALLEIGLHATELPAPAMVVLPGINKNRKVSGSMALQAADQRLEEWLGRSKTQTIKAAPAGARTGPRPGVMAVQPLLLRRATAFVSIADAGIGLASCQSPCGARSQSRE